MTDSKDYTHTCVICGTEFRGNCRKDDRTCSGTCRQRLARKRTAIRLGIFRQALKDAGDASTDMFSSDLFTLLQYRTFMELRVHGHPVIRTIHCPEPYRDPEHERIYGRFHMTVQIGDATVCIPDPGAALAFQSGEGQEQ